MAASLSRVKRYGIVLAVAAMLATAGCAGVGSSPDGTEANATTAAEPTSQQTEQATTQATTGDTQTTSADNESSTGNESRTVAASGEMAVVIDDQRLDLGEVADANESSPFWVDASGATATWQRTDADVTLAEALAKLGVNVTENGVAYEGTTYEDSGNTSVAVRVNGNSVDADEYVLQQGDEIWVVAITQPLEETPAGDHIDHDDLHVHGYINMTVNGEEVNFSQSKYKTPGHNQYFHFEGHTAPLWHAHAWGVQLGYAMGTLPGINVTEDSVTYENTTYERSDAGTSITIQVNGEPVDPSTYVLKDGDKVTIEVESSNGSG